jgi:hypothetical protein
MLALLFAQAVILSAERGSAAFFPEISAIISQHEAAAGRFVSFIVGGVWAISGRSGRANPVRSLCRHLGGMVL